MNSKTTLYLLFSLHYAAMQELGSPQGGLPGARAHDHDYDQNSLVIKLLVLLITLIILLIIRKKMEILIIQSIKKLAEEEVSSPSFIMKNAKLKQRIR